jgi:hypothetical protein
VKSKLDKSELRKAVKKLESVKALGSGHRNVRIDDFRGILTRPIRCVFAYDGPDGPWLARTLEALGGYGIVDIVCVLSRGAYVSAEIRSHATRDDYLSFDDPPSGLAALYFHLCHHAARAAAASVFPDLRPYFATPDR